MNKIILKMIFAVVSFEVGSRSLIALVRHN